MKFNDGFWLLKNGVKPYYGLQLTQSSAAPDGLGYDLSVATRSIRHRGDTLGGTSRLNRSDLSFHYTVLGPVLSVRVYSPTRGVIGVKIDHFSHLLPFPNITLFPDAPPIPDCAIKREDHALMLTSGGLTAEITENPYTINFKSPSRVLTAAGEKYQALLDVPSRWTLGSASNSSCLALDYASNPNPSPLPTTVKYINSELNLSPGELVYGFGEQFGAFVKNGEYQNAYLFNILIAVNQVNQLRSGIKMVVLRVIRPINASRFT
jgi:hypothetical protein